MSAVAKLLAQKEQLLESFLKRVGAGGSDFSLDDHAFAMKIALALKSELKDRNSRAKLVASWTGANERTVKSGF